MNAEKFQNNYLASQKSKSSAWDAAGSGRRFFHFQPELGSINNLLSQKT